MPKGEVPIAYIIAIMLGVVAVAFLGYWLFIVQQSGGIEMSADECRAKAVEYCSRWRFVQWSNYAELTADPPKVGMVIGDKWFSKEDSTSSGNTPFAPRCPNTGLDETSKRNLKASCETII